MTLFDIITTSLQMLERGTDSHTIENYRAQFTKYANDGVNEVLRRIKQQREAVVPLDSKKSFNLSVKDAETNDPCFDREVIRISDITIVDNDEERSVFFYQKPSGSGTFYVKVPKDMDASEVTECNVYYRYAPKEMTATTDVPEMPSYMHYVIPYYVVAMARMNTDPYSQGTASAYMQQFYSKVQQLEREARAEPESFMLLNY